jgi:hypothetical protein
MSTATHKVAFVQADIGLNTQIDCIEVLGHPAKGVRWRDTSATGSASITLHFNSLNRIVKANETQCDTIAQVWVDFATWAAAKLQYPNVTLTDGQSVGQGTGTYEGLEIRSIHVTGLHTDARGDCELEIW